jgi:hypothetical protein
MRLKHNKKRNTAFLYEALVRELTKSVVRQNKYKIKLISGMLKETFAKGSHLYKELNIYRALYEGSSMTKDHARRLMTESKLAYDRLNKREIFKEQSKLINRINKTLSPEVFKTFIPNYKNIASVYSIFNVDASPKDKILLEDKVLETLLSEVARKDLSLEHIDNIVYSSFVKKFNKKYAHVLKENQRKLLNKFIASFGDNNLELKVFLNEEIEELKNKLKNSYNDKTLVGDKDLITQIKKVGVMIENFRKEPVDVALVRKVIKIQDLVEEIQDHVN